MINRQIHKIEDDQFRAFLVLLMCSDPMPIEDNEHRLVKDMANDLSVKRGFKDWVEAYHEFV